jgi:hypothetical protein
MKRLLIGAFLLLAQYAVAQTPADEALMHWEGGINATRTDRLLALAPTIMPSCDIAASKEDVDKFYAFWRFAVQEEIDQYNASGRPLVDPNEEKQRLQMKQFGMTILRQYQLPELAHIGPEMPNADEAVVHQIKIWKALHCVVEKYDGKKFFTNNGTSRMGMNWPYDTILSTFGHDLIPVDPEKTEAYRLPNMLDIEPLDALGRFFREAEAKGDLAFPDENAEKYFFQRYESDYFYDMTDVSKARAWFHTPPWNPDAPHLERPTRPIRAHSDK